MPSAALKAASAPPATPRRDPRRRILDAARQCFVRGGFHATSMHEICAAAEMSPGALYRYFPSKDAIIIAIVEEERSERAELVALLDTATSFAGALSEMGRRLFAGETSFLCAELGPEIFAEATRNPKMKAMFETVEDEIDGAMRRALARAQARGEVARDIDTEQVMLLLNAIGDGLVMRYRLYDRTDMAAQMPALGALIARMLAPAPAPATEQNP
ncbi:TetR/AcrR family transcriptional regulator [Ancylobacter terrae]|uniref:TetR/AcrR family transcriptional regulator n=1 Tax=Ancylobacter sp. sgz301288 TaxID=3342077 RepID=UPI00385D67B4